MEEDQYLATIQMLNVQQRKIFDDFVHRLYDSPEDDPFYLYIGGNAGKPNPKFIISIFLLNYERFGALTYVFYSLIFRL